MITRLLVHIWYLLAFNFWWCLGLFSDVEHRRTGKMLSKLYEAHNNRVFLID